MNKNRDFGHEDAAFATADHLGSIVYNENIKKFLETNDKFYLVGPKGSGKSLLLLKKAIEQRQLGDAVCVPSTPDKPVDRLAAAQHVGRKFHHSLRGSSDEHLAWAAVWKHSICRSVLHHIVGIIGKSVDEYKNSYSEKIYSEFEAANLLSSKAIIKKFLRTSIGSPKGPYHYYMDVCAKLDDGRQELLKNVREELIELDEILDIARPPVYVFLDNLDDYYEKEPELWVSSMYGQFRAVREIALSHRNVHVYTSIRQDVFHQFNDELRLQYRDYVIPLAYSKEELCNIFKSRIVELHDDLLIVPAVRAQHPWKAFFGEAETIYNSAIDVSEPVRDYLCRHTLHRPRDMVHVGTILLEQRPPEGFDVDLIRHAVHAAQDDIAKQYLAEIKPLLDPRFNVETFLRRYVTSNVLDELDIRRIRDKFVAENVKAEDRDEVSDLTKPFETLVELGLFGFGRLKPNSTEFYQYFNPPGQGLQEPENRTMPATNLLFLHPILTGWIQSGSIDTEYLVGRGYPIPDVEEG